MCIVLFLFCPTYMQFIFFCISCKKKEGGKIIIWNKIKLITMEKRTPYIYEALAGTQYGV